ncbi:hypothetical protein DC852_23710 [Vibrio parahaemolyticus]|uniref:hypothetical protein n=1 Tax=Vibrio parahaemolyticus TaxID=670 RepID=UPI001D6BEAE1|nr:hypothetical protein [Vibrio parahaemolyticus]EGQ8277515.1 hypothetical protein [Vibrio parahaemolyticus]EGQ8942607.1 hypothetical protein [Vibrio parahaemolyticus]EGQ8952148.1 hypothetical protein [Vibrio parahaemolyticus]EGQ8972219.1 hypothetical protein [Vibrio parahaemolyticus]EGR2993558.1 hypothetical protein [Vibrio parahaemolyticus]
MSTDYEISVFINCPFDSQFEPLFEAILFTIYKCGLKPRCALEHDDAGETRIDKINSIIADCKYGIHDISRTELDSHNSLPRFNMPLELGLFLGCKNFANGRSSEKITIIFDSVPYRYMQFISDISGQDIKTHDNNPQTLIQNLRSSFNTNLGGGLPGATAIYSDYTAYQLLKPTIKSNLNLHDDDDLTYSDHVQIIQQWMRLNS